MKEQQIIILCIPVRRSHQRKVGISAYKPGDDYEKTKCSSCGMEVWIGPRQRAALKEHKGARVLCHECGNLNRDEATTVRTHLGGLAGDVHLASGEVFTDQDIANN